MHGHPPAPGQSPQTPPRPRARPPSAPRRCRGHGHHDLGRRPGYLGRGPYLLGYLMTSAIDPTVPVAGNPTTVSVRTNFATAASEITALQSQQSTNTTNIATHTTQIAALQSGTVTAVTGTTGQISSTGGQTPALSFPASMDLTGVTVANAAITSGTMNGVVIGGSSPAAGTFTTGAFSGNVTI